MLRAWGHRRGAGYELSPTAGGIYELLRDCSELVPGIDELRIDELSVGLRPGTPDNAPAIGHGALRGSCGRRATTATASCSPR